MRSTEPSVLPPSMTKYSWMNFRWAMMERSVSSRNRAWLKLGVTTVMRTGKLSFLLARADQALVMMFPVFGYGAPIIVLQRISAAIIASAGAPAVIFDRSLQRFASRIDVNGDHLATAGGFHIGIDIDLIGNEDGAAAGHRFNDGNAEVFLVTGESEERGIHVGFEALTAMEHAGEEDAVRDAVLCNHLAHVLFVSVTIGAGDDEVGAANVRRGEGWDE